jgi:hypothetical protein
VRWSSSDSGKNQQIDATASELERNVAERDDTLRELLSANSVQSQRISWLESALSSGELDDVALTLSKGDFTVGDGA